MKRVRLKATPARNYMGRPGGKYREAVNSFIAAESIVERIDLDPGETRKAVTLGLANQAKKVGLIVTNINKEIYIVNPAKATKQKERWVANS